MAPVGFGVQAALALQRGDVQALVLWISPMRTWKRTVSSCVLHLPVPGRDFRLRLCQHGRKDRRAPRRHHQGGAGRAKATIFTLANPEAAACIYLVESGRWDTAADKAKAYQAAVAVVKQDAGNSRDIKTDVGLFPPGGWEKVRDYYFSLGIIKEKLPPEDYYVTDAAFYAEANNFDKEKIAAMARSYSNRCKDAK
jgi:hypothetical protein